MRLTFWVSVVLSVLYSHGTDACPDKCRCSKSSFCNGTNVNCYDRGLSGVPTNIPTDICDLYLSGNKIATLQTGNFDKLTNLHTLSLWGNDIAILPNGIFDVLTNLQFLHLWKNKIATLLNGIFDALTKLKKLGLQENELATLPNGIFDALTKLETLNLGRNKISTLKNGIFDALTKLEILIVSGNEIAILPTGLFDVLTNLQFLDLGRNKISTLSNGIFDELTKLKTLGLYENPLRCKCPLVDIIRTAKTRRLQLIDNPSCKNPVTLRKTFLKDLKLRDVVCDSDSITGTTGVETTVPGDQKRRYVNNCWFNNGAICCDLLFLERVRY
ncbi:slit homolog 3 protein-like [Ostrea edulis]|uniref:slit homolog 3 protein-like n=1 Tax=Ostrea edulis TaxID=37623 RepID=UPI0024AF3354|nr:slit homolog 3 protein-like [Ostrea edulis]